ncbi:MAG: hypothetical protein CFH10_02241 [Alphaproteobacteria bacterium MarineAlpha4_Bin2]|nr:MAG: hypothetical protein CFH10_02241 [Alphaproteobacteria bacterium MarineAlpha4_Bin2]
MPLRSGWGGANFEALIVCGRVKTSTAEVLVYSHCNAIARGRCGYITRTYAPEIRVDVSGLSLGVDERIEWARLEGLDWIGGAWLLVGGRAGKIDGNAPALVHRAGHSSNVLTG